MSNPYLSAAEEVTGQNLREDTPRVTLQEASQIIKNQYKKVHNPTPDLKQQPVFVSNTKSLPQNPSFVPGMLGELSNFSKFRKMLFLAALGAGFAASKMFFGRYEVLLLAEHPEYKDLKSLMPKIKKITLPIIGIFAFPVVLALFTDKEWPMVAWLCWLGAIAYALKEAGPNIIRIIRETKGAADEYKEQKLDALRKRVRKK